MARQYILAIEHNWRIRKLIRANLEALGIEVREAVSRQHGLECLEKGRPDVILLDLDLPGGSAVQLLHAVDLQFPASPVPVILLSAEPPARSVLQEAHVSGFLLKPFDASILVERVRHLLGAVPASGSD